MRAYFTRRAQAAAVVAGALSLATLAELHGSNPALYGRLHRPGTAAGGPGQASAA